MGGDLLPGDGEREHPDATLVSCREGGVGFPSSGRPGFETLIVITDRDGGIVEVAAML